MKEQEDEKRMREFKTEYKLKELDGCVKRNVTL